MAILAQQYPVYQPSMRIISSVSNAPQALVTTTFAHQYLTGTICRLHIPEGFGMSVANSLHGPITVTGTTTFLIGIDTTQFPTWSVPVTWPESAQSAVVVPIGELNNQLTAAVQNALPYTAT